MVCGALPIRLSSAKMAWMLSSCGTGEACCANAIAARKRNRMDRFTGMLQTFEGKRKSVTERDWGPITQFYFRIKPVIAQIPRSGPTAMLANAACQPKCSPMAAMRRITKAVSRKPRAVCRVSAVPM